MKDNVLTNLRGLRYPDEFLIRMFYKLSLDKSKGRVLELGCGDGNNLVHFSQYGWDCVGIDISVACIGNAKHNLALVAEDFQKTNLILHDLSFGLPADLDSFYDAIIMPSSLYYIEKSQAINCLRDCAKLVKPGSCLYIRIRLPDDHRAGRGTLIGENSWKLDIEYTGECGLTNVFWDEYEFLNVLSKIFKLNPMDLVKLKLTFDNLQHGRIVRNSELVIWGVISEESYQ